MKHIFSIHSNITYLAALGAIIKENIKMENVVFICNSGYKPALPLDFKGETFKGMDETASERNIISKLRLFSYTKNAQNYIRKISGNEKFIAYIDLMSTFNKYLAFHKKCISFNIIEEGIVNYGEYYDLNLLTADLKNNSWLWYNKKNIKELLLGFFRLYRGRSIKMGTLPIHPNIYAQFLGVKVFCFSNMSFPEIDSKKKRILSFNNLLGLSLDTNEFPEGTWFWIGDVLSKQYGVSMDHFKDAGDALLKSIGEGKGRKIFVKFRGGESKSEKEITVAFLKKNGFDIVFLPDDTIMELVFAKGLNFHICGIASSLLIYGKIFGHKTHSMLPYIPDVYGISIYKSYPTLMKNVYYNE